MDLEQARETKQQLAGYARDLAERYGTAARPSHVGGPEAAEAVRAPTLALGLAPVGDDAYTIAVRYRLGVPAARSIARRIAAEAGPGPDVRRTGRIRTLQELSASGDALRPRPPVAAAYAEGETDRVRPLRPGVSIGHVDVTAGTLGGFALGPDGERFAFSNYHVLAGSPSARAGDVVLQPGPADGGDDPADRVGTLARVAPLEEGVPAFVDAAIALLDDGVEIDPTYPVGAVAGMVTATGGEAVAKVGRTTSHTRGRVSAIELDGVLVGYGEELGVMTFDDQIEIESTDDSPFSRGGDSGSLVYREDGMALGLLFAGSETGGTGGTGLTYANPIAVVMETLQVSLYA
jgi:hypothetical protein